MVEAPIEAFSRVGFASRCDVTVAYDPLAGKLGIMSKHDTSDIREAPVLCFGVGHGFGALQLNSNGKVIASPPSVEYGNSSMPGPAVKRDILGHGSLAIDQQMSRDFEVCDRTKVRVPFRR